METIKEFIDGNKAKIAMQVGYDIQDIDADTLIVTLIEAGIDDMKASGVTESTIIHNRLSIITLVLFIKDNLSLDGGKSETSPMYISNVQKLKLRPYIKEGD